MRKIICDRCKAECTDGKHVMIRISYSGGECYSGSGMSFDYCSGCADELKLAKERRVPESAGERLESLLREIAAEEVECGQ